MPKTDSANPAIAEPGRSRLLLMELHVLRNPAPVPADHSRHEVRPQEHVRPYRIAFRNIINLFSTTTPIPRLSSNKHRVTAITHAN